jgi:hypothetical protein
MSAPTIRVVCPCCQTRLTVDPELASVLAHEAPPRSGPARDLDAAFGALQSQSAQREERFRQQMQNEATKGRVLQRKFEEGLRKAKDSPDPPIKPIDLE